MSYPNERINELCNRLQLPFIAEHCSHLIDQASKGEMSFSEFTCSRRSIWTVAPVNMWTAA